MLVDLGDSWHTLQGIMLQGEAHVLEDEAQEQAEPDLAAARYNLGVKHGLTEAGDTVPYGATASGRSRRWIVFTPHTVVSWDNTRLDRPS